MIELMAQTRITNQRLLAAVKEDEQVMVHVENMVKDTDDVLEASRSRPSSRAASRAGSAATSPTKRTLDQASNALSEWDSPVPPIQRKPVQFNLNNNNAQQEEEEQPLINKRLRFEDVNANVNHLKARIDNMEGSIGRILELVEGQRSVNSNDNRAPYSPPVEVVSSQKKPDAMEEEINVEDDNIQDEVTLALNQILLSP